MCQRKLSSASVPHGLLARSVARPLLMGWRLLLALAPRTSPSAQNSPTRSRGLSGQPPFQPTCMGCTRSMCSFAFHPRYLVSRLRPGVLCTAPTRRAWGCGAAVFGVSPCNQPFCHTLWSRARGGQLEACRGRGCSLTEPYCHHLGSSFRPITSFAPRSGLLVPQPRHSHVHWRICSH